jgi:hypothetical protein
LDLLLATAELHGQDGLPVIGKGAMKRRTTRTIHFSGYFPSRLILTAATASRPFSGAVSGRSGWGIG